MPDLKSRLQLKRDRFPHTVPEKDLRKVLYEPTVAKKARPPPKWFCTFSIARCIEMLTQVLKSMRSSSEPPCDLVELMPFFCNKTVRATLF